MQETIGWWGLYGWLWLTAAVLSWAISPWLIRLAFKTGYLDRPGHRKIHEQPKALLGGLAVYLGFWVTIGVHLLGMALLVHWRPDWIPNHVRVHIDGVAYVGGRLWGLFGAGSLLVCVGLIDDRIALSARSKLVAQVAAALVLYGAGVGLSLFLPSDVLKLAATVLWVVVVTNAMNFLDNMDGLCSGIGAIAAALFGVVGALQGQYFIALLAFPLSGAMAGFLPFNLAPARAFLGDTGSLFIGVMLASLAMLETFYQAGSATVLPVVAPLIILAVPLHDMAATIWVRIRLGRPVYKGDTNHISHRLVRLGLTRRQAVGLICCLSGTLGLGAAAMVGASTTAVWLILLQTLILLSILFLMQLWGHRANDELERYSQPETAARAGDEENAS
ncbi:MAG: MraY family glycosyltransferase [Verrucomicrobiota bacterium]|nr:MraY family glycosyltransferase [Verrucomicrobiota bacterium]